MTTAALAASVIFLLVFALITTERTHKATAALVGAALVLVLRLVDQHTAFHGEPGGAAGVDWNTIFLLVGTMIIVNVTKRTGVFQWAAIRAAKLVRGRPASLLVALCVVAAVLSAFLNNVTTIMLIAPVTILFCDVLETDAVPFLICTVIASNLGGGATLIGHPPNIMIGSAAGFSFTDFLRVDLPFIAVVLTLFLLATWLFLRRTVQVPEADRLRLLALDESTAITDRPLLHRCVIVMGLTLAGFVAHGWLGLEPATIALAGAALLLLLHREGPEEVLREVEWPTLLFFIGVFIMVSALVKNGVMQLLGHGLFLASHGSVPALTLGTLWLSGGVCGVVEPVSFTAAMIPLVQSVAHSLHPAASPAELAGLMRTTNLQALWWALSLGANLGANLTLIAAATNVVAAGIGERTGHRITFRRFLRYGLPLTLVNLVLASVYLWVRFLR
jgi:Na+/H+ antiporter NhaD/arsenite permease-like protein